MTSEQIVAVVTKMMEHADAEKNPFTEKTQYNIRVDGEVAKSFVFNMKELKVQDGPIDDADIAITIDDEDFVSVFKGEALLAKLLADKKIEVSGDEELIEVLDGARTALLEKLKEIAEEKGGD